MGVKWNSDVLLTDGAGNRYGVSGSPAVCVYRDKLYLVRQGREDSGWLWCAVFDGETWGTDRLIPRDGGAYGVSGSPALCVYQDKLHLVHGGRNDSGWIWWATFDGTTWGTDQLIPTSDHAYGLSGSPALCVYQDKLHLVHGSRHDDGYIWWATYDGKTWGSDQLIPTSDHAYGLSGSPALCAYQGKLHLFHAGRGETDWTWWATYDGTTWGWPDQLIPTSDHAYGVSDSPAAHVYENQIFLLRQGRKNSGWTWCATFNGKTWGPDELIPDPGTAYGVTTSPAVADYRGVLYCVRQGRHNDGWVWAGTGVYTLLDPTS
jgi:chitinase